MTTLDVKPVIFREGAYSLEELDNFYKSAKIWKKIDIYEPQLRELFEINNPTLIYEADFEQRREDFIEHQRVAEQGRPCGNWVYFPWSGILLHTVPEEAYARLRTNRNKNLITEEEQRKLSDACVGIIGLSVGSGVASALAYAGIASRIKLAEFDTLETTNLNRIRARIDQVGMRKIDIAEQALYEIDPYIIIDSFHEKMDVALIEKFITQDPKPRVIFEIIDSFEMKIHLRALARKYGIPVIMVTNLGDRVLMDVERYDLDNTIEYFNGRAGKVPHDILEQPDISSADKHKYAVDLAGVDHIPQKALDSVAEIGKTLVGRPQLASTVTIASGVSSYLTRKIILGQPLPSCSWLINLDEIFIEKTAL